MTEDELIAELKALRLDEESFRAISLLPLVEVAWAEKTLAPEERKTILEIAEGHGLLRGRAHKVVEGWLTQRPHDSVMERGRRVLVHLAHRKDGLGADLPPESLDAIQEFCVHVAESAGGILGTFWKVSGEEKKAIKRITRFLNTESKDLADPTRGVVGRTVEVHWHSLLKDLSDTKEEI
jgi:hypothetical protein